VTETLESLPRPRPPAPRIELEPLPAPRLEPTELVPVLEPPKQLGTIPLLLGGAGVLALGLAALGTFNFVVDQFLRTPALGWLTLAVAVTGFGLIGAGIGRELRGLFGLRTVDRLRAELAAGEVAQARAGLRRWLAHLPDAEARSILAAVEAANDPDAIEALLRAGPLAALRARSDALGRNAAVQIFAATAAVPHPLFDGLLVGWRGVRLVRQIAELHGMRPGLLGTLALLRRTALSAAGVVAADLAIDAISRAVLTHPLLRHLTGDVASAGVAARRMIVLARAADEACSPLPPAKSG
jgi:putative membrane protein